MRPPHLHVPHIGWPLLTRPRFTFLPRAGFWRLPTVRSGPLARADLLALVLAVTLATAVVVALLLSR